MDKKEDSWNYFVLYGWNSSKRFIEVARMENRNTNSTGVISVEIINIMMVVITGGAKKKPSRIIKEIQKNVSFVNIIIVIHAIVKIISCSLWDSSSARDNSSIVANTGCIAGIVAAISFLK